MHKWQIKPGSRGDFAGPRDGPNPADEYDPPEDWEDSVTIDIEELKRNHDPNDESHQGKIGTCIYCLMIEHDERTKL